MPSDIRSKILRLASPDVMFFTLAWLMIIVIAGTVAQKYIGLYQAQRIFFSAWLMWLGPVPLPGGLAALAIIFFCLCIKLIFASAWTPDNAGIIVTHMGGLVLLVGGLLTSVASTDGSMVIYEGGSANYIGDYHARELAVYDGDRKIYAVPLEKLMRGATLSIPGLPATIVASNACRNCAVTEDGKTVKIHPAELAKEDEQNRSGVILNITGADASSNGAFVLIEDVGDGLPLKLNGKNYRLRLEKRRTYLPFSIALKSFEKETHPGTDIARSYRSLVTLEDGATEWPSIIEMNAPLRYKGYTFFQSSFFEEDGKKATVLAVVKNAGRMFPYISGIVICIGLILHMMLRLPKLVKGIIKGRVNKLVALLFLLCVMPHHAQAETSFDYSAFKAIPVLDQGRVKPLSTVAQNYLKEFYGASSLPDMTAPQWFAELIFTPEAAYNRDVFNISDPRVVDALGLPHRSPHAYSYHEVGMGLLQNPKTWQGLFALPENQLTPSQKELMNVYSETKLYGQLARSLSLLFPEFNIPAGPIAKALGVPPNTKLTYKEMLAREAALDNLARNAMQWSIDNPLEPPRLRSGDARAILDIEKQLDTMSDDRQNDAFKIIPPQWESDKAGKLWFSPWGVTFQGQGAPDVVRFLVLWQNLVAAYRNDNSAAFLAASQAIDAESLRMAGDGASASTLRLEVAYNDYQPFKISMGFYALAFALVLISLMLRGNKIYYASAVSLLIGFIFHGAGLLSRMIIMGRPPVTNLYASIIFVGFMVALVAMIYEWRMRNRIGLIVAALAGLLLQFLGLSYDAEGETMGMLIAVLDTNFWLSTHVVCMTTGYACCILGALMAHVYLILRMAQPGTPQLEELSRNIRGVGYLALTFAATGTILGGIWADQSWGRFWGWDPKENGALLICLWLLFLAHGRMAGRLKELGYNIGMALTSVIVGLAWFGVNLLAVGLHSYGFTQGAATGLFAFIGCEILFAAVSYMVIIKWRRVSL